MATDVSRVELIRDQIAAGLRVIRTENGYRNTIKNLSYRWADPADMMNLPALALILGDEKLENPNAGWRSLRGKMPVYIWGFFEQTEVVTYDQAQEGLIHDVKRALYPLCVANVGSTTNLWVFDTSFGWHVRRAPDFGDGKGIFSMEFSVIVHNVGEEF